VAAQRTVRAWHRFHCGHYRSLDAPGVQDHGVWSRQAADQWKQLDHGGHGSGKKDYIGVDDALGQILAHGIEIAEF
jgi:hypothetical protein